MTNALVRIYKKVLPTKNNCGVFSILVLGFLPVCLFSFSMNSVLACDRIYPFRSAVTSASKTAFLDFEMLSELLGVQPSDISLTRHDCIPQNIVAPQSNNLSCLMHYTSPDGDNMYLFRASFAPGKVVQDNAIKMVIDNTQVFIVPGIEDRIDRLYANTAPDGEWYSLNYIPPLYTQPEARLKILQILPSFASAVFVCSN